MKKSKLFGSRLIQNIRVPRTPNVVMLDRYDNIKKIDFEEGDLLDAKTIQRITKNWYSGTIPEEPTFTGKWGDIQGDITTLKDLVDYVKDHAVSQDAIDESVKESLKGLNPNGIPVYNKDFLDAHDIKDNLQPPYITIPDSETDLNNKNISREIKQDGTYVDILFSAIRKLQSEVAKLRNSFIYGIQSYNDEYTVSSSVESEYSKFVDDEPLWALEKEDMSFISDIIESRDVSFKPKENTDVTIEGLVTANGIITWEDEANDLESIEDAKLVFYFRLSNLNTKITFDDGTYVQLSSVTNVNLTRYNVMIVIHRLENNNYIWISITNPFTNDTVEQGYLKENSLVNSKTLCNANRITKVDFIDQTVYKFSIYSKAQSLSSDIPSTMPTEENYRYKAAHITIRSVESKPVLDKLIKYLPNNELVWTEKENRLWIKTSKGIKPVGLGGGSGDNDSDNMTNEEVIKILNDMGIIKDTGKGLEINDIASLTFIHLDSGKRYKLQLNSNGDLYSTELNASPTLESRVLSVSSNMDMDNEGVRGFIGKLRIAENNSNPSNINIKQTADAGLNSDRVKIGAIYAPYTTDKIHGCSHCYVELENTADSDFNLSGCYIHWAHPNDEGVMTTDHLGLTGVIPAGGTYLIRGAHYIEDAQTYIKVNSFDQEWFVNGLLADFAINTKFNSGYGFALTYGHADTAYNEYLYDKSSASTLQSLIQSNDTATYPYLLKPYFIDGIYYYQIIKGSDDKPYWANMAANITPNSLYKNTFELDPAKLAFLAFNTKDSSRVRWGNANDILILDLNDEFITFPHSKYRCAVSLFAPKASFENKNVCTDKSKLDVNKPNMVTVSYGINVYRTRCFNWVSIGSFDEYVWVKKHSDSTWSKSFESYKNVDEAVAADTSSYPYRKEFSKELNNAAYARILNRFPADNSFYTVHKCILEITNSSVSSPVTYDYIVGRADTLGNPDLEHCSDVLTFTLYPETYEPRVYQITDLQGFTWIEYQAWAAAANEVNSKIEADKSSENIMPILIDTGDMTQNGTRINEWYDYYSAGSCLFDHMEQMNVVGNNDLCNTDVTALGTGDDNGKSNSYFYSLFYCYEIDEQMFLPVVNNKFIPSLYYFGTTKYRFVMLNSEITEINCRDWFKLLDDNGETINIYTGYTIGKDKYNDSFTSIYSMVYKMLTTDKSCIVCMHESPFTVITNSSLKDTQKNVYRSLDNKGKLVGSHTNQISTSDVVKGLHWASRLMEQKHVKLCICGHKHTYMCTYPLLEYFTWDNGLKNSKDNYSEYTMGDTLQNDNISFEYNDINLSKVPLTKRSAFKNPAPSGFYPYTPVDSLSNGVVYFMCQATGYKLTSNKELPSASLAFSMLVPKTSVTSAGKDTPDKNQKYPMFAIFNLPGDDIKVKLVRIQNILDSGFNFKQGLYSKDDMKLLYIVQNNLLTTTGDVDNYGKWQDQEAFLIDSINAL